MAGIIGQASDFYRLRVTRVDDSVEPDLEWREDILYRRPASEVPAESVVYRVEAVSVDNDESAWPLEDFTDSEEAYAFLESAAEDLASLTKSRFDERYAIA